MQIGEWHGDEGGVHWDLASTVLRSTAAVKVFRLELTLKSAAREEHFTTLRAQGNHGRLSP
jgi:hypothetical protein